MKTLADLKRKLTVGTVLVMTWHRFQDGTLIQSNTGPTIMPCKAGVGLKRTIVKVRATEIGFHREDKEEGHVSWLTLPKASELRIDSENTFTVLDDYDKQPLLSYVIQ